MNHRQVEEIFNFPTKIATIASTFYVFQSNFVQNRFRPKSEIFILNQVLQGTQSMEHQLKDLQNDVGEIYTNTIWKSI